MTSEQPPVEPHSGSVQCRRCCRIWQAAGPGSSGPCPSCESWNTVPRPASRILLTVLILVAAATCYLLRNPQALLRWLGK